MITALYDFVRRTPFLKTAARSVIRTLKIDISKLGNRLGMLNKLLWIISGQRKDKLERLNIGGAHFYKKGWGVLDFTGWKYRFLPLTVDWEHNLASFRPFPLRGGQMRCVYTSHCIEHIPETFAAHNFSEMFRIMQGGGIIHLTLPDFDAGYEKIMARDEDFFRFIGGHPEIERNFMHYFISGYWGETLDADSIREKLRTSSKEEIQAWASELQKDIPQSWIEKHQDHVSWWSFEKLETFMRAAGFTDFVRLKKGRSRTGEMRGTGLSWGFDAREGHGSLYMEARKPA